LALAAFLLAFALVAWGSSAGATRASRASAGASSKIPLVKGKMGGTLNVLANSDTDYLDPGQTYYAFGYEIAYATQRPLYSYKAESYAAIPDVAAGQPKVTNKGMTVTVNIKPHIYFSPPVNREVTSADVKYAIERAFSASVPNSYAQTYFGVIKGTPDPNHPPTHPKSISGITTPSRYQIVFHLKRADGAFASALVMPMTAPVPKSFAGPYDQGKKGAKTYNEHVVATGPYEVKNPGNVVGADPKKYGWQKGVRITLVRNPRWNRATDYRPAYLKQVNFIEGYADAGSATDKILSGKNADVNGDFAPPKTRLQDLIENHPHNIYFTAVSGTRQVALNTQWKLPSTSVKPFSNIHLRKAVAYILDKTAMRQQRGGPAVGQIANHFISPTFAGNGWEASGRNSFHPFATCGNAGDIDKAKAEMKLAANSSDLAPYINASTGKWTGPQMSMVAAPSGTAGGNTALIVINDLDKIGLMDKNSPNALFVTDGITMYTDWCNVVDKEPAICPNVGWLADFADPETLLDVTFNGKYIIPQNNSNWGQLNNPTINAAMDKAEKTIGRTPRAKAWGAIDKMVTNTAAEIPWLYDLYPTVFSSRVNPARQVWNEGGPDISYISVK